MPSTYCGLLDVEAAACSSVVELPMAVAQTARVLCLSTCLSGITEHSHSMCRLSSRRWPCTETIARRYNTQMVRSQRQSHGTTGCLCSPTLQVSAEDAAFSEVLGIHCSKLPKMVGAAAGCVLADAVVGWRRREPWRSRQTP